MQPAVVVPPCGAVSATIWLGFEPTKANHRGTPFYLPTPAGLASLRIVLFWKNATMGESGCQSSMISACYHQPNIQQPLRATPNPRAAFLWAQCPPGHRGSGINGKLFNLTTGMIYGKALKLDGQEFSRVGSLI